MSFKRWAHFFNAHALLISLFFILLTAGSSYFVVKLYANLKPDVEELLPTSSRSVQDLKEVTARLRSIDNLAVLIFSKDAKKAGEFQNDLAHALEKLPSTVSAQVEYKISDELHFFGARKSLFISEKDLNEVREFIENRIGFEKFIANPINLVIEDKPTEPIYDFKALEESYASQSSVYSHFPGGVYATEDGTKRLILVYAPDQSIDTAHALKNAVAQAVKNLDPKKYAPDLEVKFSGNVQDIIEEQAALLSDLSLSTLLVTILVSLVLWIYYRSFFATLALIFSLLVGTLLTFGLSYFIVGSLNANSAFLGSIVMGNGINFGIMILARYLEERRAHRRTHLEALEISMRSTMLPTFTAALAAGLSYGSLMLTSFRGFSQFGVIGFLGMASCWICAYTFFPAILSLFEKNISFTSLKSVVGNDRRTESRALWSMALRKILTTMPGTIAVMGLLITLASLYSLTKVNHSIIESDLTKLRDRRSMQEGSGYLTRYIDLILKRYSSPLAVLTHSSAQSEAVAKKIKELKASQGAHSMIQNVTRIDDFVPAHQIEKIKILKSIQETLSPQIMWHLSPEEKKKVHEFVSPQTLSPFDVTDLPPKLLERFREKDNSLGNLVLVEPTLSDEIRQGEPLMNFVKEIRAAVDSVADQFHTKIPVAGRLPVSADMLEAITREGPVATLVSWLAVVFLTLVLFRNFQLSVLVLGSLLMGVLWLVGAIVFTGLKINFLNFIALPITFGIGVDYAVNVFQRYREEKVSLRIVRAELDAPQIEEVAVIRAVYHTGGAVVLASFTTIIGWGSLLIAGNQAFVSFGKIAVLGEISCVMVAVLIIPATLIALRKRKIRT
jgi:predicted RND superfamily exporter protein